LRKSLIQWFILIVACCHRATFYLAYNGNVNDLRSAIF
jgi:hypothetical protein